MIGGFFLLFGISRCCKRTGTCRAAQTTTARLRIRKVNQNGTPLPLAAFVLEDARGIRLTKRTDASGRVSFALQPGIRYTLRETVPPVGYYANASVYRVYANASGTVFLNGSPGTLFTLLNLPIT